MIDIYAEIRKRYGNVRRARGYYLYTEKNVRLLDLWLDGGKALLGRRAGQANLVCKQFLDRGLTGWLPTNAENRLQRALEAAVPGYPVIRLYATEEKAAGILRSALHIAQNDAEHPLPIWRPFLAEGEAVTDERAAHITADGYAQRGGVMLIPPAYPLPCGIIAAESRFADVLPPSDTLFPPLAACLARAFFDLQKKIAAFQADAAECAVATPLCGEKESSAELHQRVISEQRIGSKQRREALKRRAEAERLIPQVWNQNGWYLFPHVSQAEYENLFMHALDAHVLISPDYAQPSILPDCENYAELIKWLKMRRSYQ